SPCVDRLVLQADERDADDLPDRPEEAGTGQPAGRVSGPRASTGAEALGGPGQRGGAPATGDDGGAVRRPGAGAVALAGAQRRPDRSRLVRRAGGAEHPAWAVAADRAGVGVRGAFDPGDRGTGLPGATADDAGRG